MKEFDNPNIYFCFVFVCYCEISFFSMFILNIYFYYKMYKKINIQYKHAKKMRFHNNKQKQNKNIY